MMPRALIINKKDNVATALARLEKGEAVKIDAGEGAVDVVLSEVIPFGHKLAVKDIGKGAPVVKYGEIIGSATVAISMGEHVHVHNVEGLRGRGDKK